MIWDVLAIVSMIIVIPAMVLLFLHEILILDLIFCVYKRIRKEYY